MQTECFVVTAWCTECGAAVCVKVHLSGGIDEHTMLHKPWCSVDMRNVRRTVRVVQQ